MSNLKRNMTKYGVVAIFLIVGIICAGILALKGWASFPIHNPFGQKVADETTINEGPLTKVVVTAGPFDIHRHYLSMEGPWVAGHFTPAELVASGNINLPEGMVEYIENGSGPASMHGMMNAPDKGRAKPEGVVQPTGQRELYWFKGVKLEVLDENGNVQPTAEFICHWNLDVDPKFRNKVFKEGHYTQNDRLSSISQGETCQILPPGYGVPVASDEPWQLSFQAANRTTDAHRRVRHRCTLYFVKDKDLVYPMKALYWYVPYVTVVVDKNSQQIEEMQKRLCPMCIPASEGVDAPNDRAGGTFRDPLGRVLSGHWVIPVGVHTYRDYIREPRDDNFQKGNPIIRAAWTHVHPLCTKLSLVEVTDNQRIPVMSADCETKTTPGLQIMRLDFLTPKNGAQLHEKSQYELEVTYNNTLNKAVDSMASMGIYMEDPTFARPKWALHDYKPEDDKEAQDQQTKETQMSCAITNSHSKSDATADAKTETKADTNLDLGANADANAANPMDKGGLALDPHAPDRKTLPMFDPKKDGPYLSKVQPVEIMTTSGPIDITLEPSLAPKTCTHFAELMKNGSYIGTPFFDYEANGFLVVSQAVDKHPGSKFLSQNQMSKLRRLPVESNPAGEHVPRALSVCRDDNDTNSATSSFCVVLSDAKQLDGKYTIFGHVSDDNRTTETLRKIAHSWNSSKDRPYILSCKLK